jgi:hypothetical protein
MYDYYSATPLKTTLRGWPDLTLACQSTAEAMFPTVRNPPGGLRDAVQ